MTFYKGNRYGKGRPPGSLNRPKEYPFMQEDSTSVSARRFRTLNALGLKQEPIDVTPVLNEYLSALPAETQDLAAAADESEG